MRCGVLSSLSGGNHLNKLLQREAIKKSDIFLYFGLNKETDFRPFFYELA